MKASAAIVGVLAAAGVARADTAAPAAPSDQTAPEKTAPRLAATGFFAEGGLGAVSFLSSVASDADAGPALTLRVGRDLFSWLSLGVYLAASSHEATVPPPPQGQWFQLYRGGVDARLGGRFERIALFVEGGIGASWISSNVLEKVMVTKPGKPYSATIHGGGGLEYQIENRHYAFGAAIDAFIEPEFASAKALETRLYLRYTYGGG
jgi:hypothetical protein